ncbi:zinc finger BED domain-containing protein 1-like [Rhizophagus irregularis DAOM 181602=DAOM 197198]|nr:zinc finger BED domain-containing protein 1-like [Rhizophagus irregularis DAOM 181602=DAOM 197198]
MKQTIYNSLFVYWNESIMIGLLAFLLDLRLKTLSNWDEETCNKAKTELIHQFKELIDLNLVTANPFSELESYLDPIRTPIAAYSVNPFEWWAIRKTQFPNVAKLARKYLSISSSSVPSERLFSDTDN